MLDDSASQWFSTASSSRGGTELWPLIWLGAATVLTRFNDFIITRLTWFCAGLVAVVHLEMKLGTKI